MRSGQIISGGAVSTRLARLEELAALGELMDAAIARLQADFLTEAQIAGEPVPLKRMGKSL